MKIIVLGTGTSQGVPVIACNCDVCRSENPKDKRLRSSVLIEIDYKTFVFDTGPDFRQQMLNNHVTKLDSVIFTHEHKDHVAGLDDVRSFNYILDKSIDVYAESRVQEALKREFAYIFAENKYPGILRINMHMIDNNAFFISGIKILPIRVFHYKLPVFGFRIQNFAYITDVKTIPEEELVKLQNLDCLLISALRKDEHISHLNLSEALRLIERINPKQAYLTHLSHRFGLHEAENKKLPKKVNIAYDGLTLDL